MRPARYYVPPHLVEPLKTSMNCHFMMAETIDALEKVNVLPFSVEDTVRVSLVNVSKNWNNIYLIYLDDKYENKKKSALPRTNVFVVVVLIII